VGVRNVVRVEEVRRLEIGVRGGQPIFDESLMITGDTNIADVQLLVQYNIEQLDLFLFNTIDPGGVTIKDVAETSLRQVVGSRLIDNVLTDEKEAVEFETFQQIQLLLNSYGTGIRVREVKLQNVRPPSQVQDAFDDVVRAREDRERIINLAEAYREDILPRARGEAARQVEAAEAYRQERIANATGQSDRFLSVLAEYRNSEEVTRQRLYLEAMEEVLPGVSKFIVDSEQAGNLLQFLPLNPSERVTQTTTPPGN
jgi:membrane protease subunit HflK